MWFPRILVLAVLVVLAVHAVRPMATYKAIALGAGPFEIGLLPTSFGALALIAAVPAGRWIDRVGEVRFITAGAGLLTASALGMAWIDSLLLLIVSQSGFGLGLVLTTIAIQTMIANRTDRERRDHRFGLFAFAVSFGQLLGPLVAAEVATRASGGTGLGDLATGPVFIIGAAAGAVALVIAPTLSSKSTSDAETPVPNTMSSVAASREVLRRPTILRAMLVSMAILISTDLMLTYLPAYGVERGLSVQLVGLLLSIRAGSSMAARLAMAYLIGVLGRRSVLTASMLLAGVAIAALPLAEYPPLLLGLVVLMGLGQGIGQPLTMSWVATQTPRQLRGTALAIRITGNRLGLVLVPAAVGAVAGAVGLIAVFLSVSGMLGAAAALSAKTPLDDYGGESTPGI